MEQTTTNPQRINPLFFVAIGICVLVIVGLQIAQSNYKTKQMVEFCKNNLSMEFYEYTPPYFYCASYGNGTIWNGSPIKVVEIQIK